MEKFTVEMLFWYIYPLVVLFAGNYIISAFSLTERLKIKSPDIAVPLLFIGLNAMSKATYQQSIVPYLIISILILGIFVAVFHAYQYGEILYGRYFKMFWRLTFLFSLFLYVLLILLNILAYF